MKNFLSTLLLLVSAGFIQAQTLYFPPLTGNTWDTIEPESLGWCPDSVQQLIDYVGENDSKALLILKGGKLVVEHYYDTFTADSIWYWASAGKSLTSFLVGLAQEEGFLSIDDPSSQYLGAGWTSCTPEQEQAITVRNQLAMTSGLDDGTGQADCTDPSCLLYLSDPGTRWAYHNAPYTLLDGVIEGATGLSLNNFFLTRVRTRTSITGLYVQTGENNVFYSTARSMARFGLLAQNKGIWQNDTIMHDQDYFYDMVHPSQDINNSYGYLWWLNGQESFMLPQSQLVFPGYTLPDAPADLYAALGKNGQYIMVSPEEDVVIVRIGNSPPGLGGLVPTIFANGIWSYYNRLFCSTTAIPSSLKQESISVYPNPGNQQIRLHIPENEQLIQVIVRDIQGRELMLIRKADDLMSLELPEGMYILEVETDKQRSFINYIRN
jgi:CubicO group peptidase (beta-lactamase class C family)